MSSWFDDIIEKVKDAISTETPTSAPGDQHGAPVSPPPDHVGPEQVPGEPPPASPYRENARPKDQEAEKDEEPAC